LIWINAGHACPFSIRRRDGNAAGAAAGLIILLSATGTSALPLTPFRYEDQAQRHCPDDVVVWLDFKKG
jgi:hypothetical protein